MSDELEQLNIENIQLKDTIRKLTEIDKLSHTFDCEPCESCEPAIDHYSYNLLREENEKLKQALINIALKL